MIQALRWASLAAVLVLVPVLGLAGKVSGPCETAPMNLVVQEEAVPGAR